MTFLMQQSVSTTSPVSCVYMVDDAADDRRVVDEKRRIYSCGSTPSLPRARRRCLNGKTPYLLRVIWSVRLWSTCSPNPLTRVTSL